MSLRKNRPVVPAVLKGRRRGTISGRRSNPSRASWDGSGRWDDSTSGEGIRVIRPLGRPSDANLGSTRRHPSRCNADNARKHSVRFMPIASTREVFEPSNGPLSELRYESTRCFPWSSIPLVTSTRSGAVRSSASDTPSPDTTSSKRRGCGGASSFPRRADRGRRRSCLRR